jgi:hypothetical protein
MVEKSARMKRGALLFVVLAFGCGAPSPTTGSCDYRTSPTNPYCQDYSGSAAAVAAYKGPCTTANGKWSDGTCPRSDAFGGCRMTSSTITETNWFYVGGPYNSEADVMNACAQGSTSMFVSP